MTKGKKPLSAASKNFVPLVARNRPSHAKHHQVIQNKPLETVCLRDVEETMLEFFEPFTDGFKDDIPAPLPDVPKASPVGSAKPVANEKTPSAANDAGRRVGKSLCKTKTEGSTKDGKASGSKPRGEHNVFTHFVNCEVCKMTKKPRPQDVEFNRCTALADFHL